MVQRFLGRSRIGTDDLAMLRRVFNVLCPESEYTMAEGDHMTVELLALFRAGYTVEAQLLAMMSRRQSGPDR
jgi:hypothetical protein